MTLVELLNQALQIRGITSAAVVSGEGFIVEGVSKDDMDLSFVGGLIASGLASSRVLAGLMGEGEVSQTMIEYENGPVLLTPLKIGAQGAGDDDFVAVVTLDSTQNLGRARFQLRKLLPQIAEVAKS
jgi:predicted regulator of Ras-like GTPase activity (Roadblock/LC7/MglB family)